MTVHSDDMAAHPPVVTQLSEKLSHYRTTHLFLHYAEFHSAEEYLALRAFADRAALQLFILGAGSNVLFKRYRVSSLVLKNSLPKDFREIDSQTIEVSSSVMIAQVLRWCHERNLESCYYLASVPATVGGAIAMNAGRGRAHNQTIFDYVSTVTLLTRNGETSLSRAEIPLSYRTTPYTGCQDSLILRAVLRFPKGNISDDPRRARLSWSKEHQDNSDANCGSVFKECRWRLLKLVRGLRIAGASYSRKTANWILNTGSSPFPIRLLILIVKVLHLLTGNRAKLEIVEVD